MKDKTLNKEVQLRVRLTPYQSQMLEELSAKLDIKKSPLVRYILDQFFNQIEKSDVLDIQ